MTIRIIVQTTDRTAAANVGGPVDILVKTFDIEAPELEAFLHAPIKDNWAYVHRQIVGAEVLSEEQPNDR